MRGGKEQLFVDLLTKLYSENTIYIFYTLNNKQTISLLLTNACDSGSWKVYQ